MWRRKRELRAQQKHPPGTARPSRQAPGSRAARAVPTSPHALPNTVSTWSALQLAVNVTEKGSEGGVGAGLGLGLRLLQRQGRLDRTAIQALWEPPGFQQGVSRWGYRFAKALVPHNQTYAELYSVRKISNYAIDPMESIGENHRRTAVFSIGRSA